MPGTIVEHVRDLLVPMSEVRNRPTDATYFLHRNGSLVFSEGPLHPPWGRFGNILYYPSDDGHNDFFGVPYASMNKRKVDGELVRISHAEQYDRHLELFPDVVADVPRPPYAEYMFAFPFEDFLGFFDNREALWRAVQGDPPLARAVGEVARFLAIHPGRLGSTGSLAYGILDEVHDDIDLVIYASVAKHLDILGRIDRLRSRDPEARVFEYGRYWPLRFHYGGWLICPFFLYEDPAECPLHGASMHLLEEDVTITGTVADDTHSIFMPPVLGIDRVEANGVADDARWLILYTGIMRGELRVGDRFAARARRVFVDNGLGEAFLVTLDRNVRRFPPLAVRRSPVALSPELLHLVGDLTDARIL